MYILYTAKCVLKVFAWLFTSSLLTQYNSSVVRKHSGIFISCFSMFSLWANAPSALSGGNQPVSEWNIRSPTHTSYIHNLPHNPTPPHPRVSLWYKNRRVRQRGHVLLWDSHQCLCVYPSTPGRHFITFSLMNSQMILVISSPSISTTGWATLMRLSASVNHTYRRVQVKPAFHSQQNVTIL